MCILSQWHLSRFWSPVSFLWFRRASTNTKQKFVFLWSLTKLLFASIPSVKVFCKNLSILQVECSGPAESKPCGRSRVRLDCLSHFDSPVVRNWSITILINWILLERHWKNHRIVPPRLQNFLDFQENSHILKALLHIHWE